MLSHTPSQISEPEFLALLLHHPLESENCSSSLQGRAVTLKLWSAGLSSLFAVPALTWGGIESSDPHLCPGIWSARASSWTHPFGAYGAVVQPQPLWVWPTPEAQCQGCRAEGVVCSSKIVWEMKGYTLWCSWFFTHVFTFHVFRNILRKLDNFRYSGGSLIPLHSHPRDGWLLFGILRSLSVFSPFKKYSNLIPKQHRVLFSKGTENYASKKFPKPQGWEIIGRHHFCFLDEGNRAWKNNRYPVFIQRMNVII